MIPKPRNIPGQTLTPIYIVPSRDLFRNEQEDRSFRIFSQETSRQLAGYFESGLWNRIVLQASETSVAVRHAVIAIGALNLKTWSFNGEAVEKRRREFVYHQYSLAIREMRKTTASGLTDSRTMLMITILFFCFELYHGNNDAAAAQVHSGIRIMDEYEKFRRTPRHLLGDIPPVEEEIIEALTRLEIQIMTFDDPRSRDVHLEKTVYGQELIDDMPVRFDSLEDAWRVLNVILKRSLHWLATIMPMSVKEEYKDQRPTDFDFAFIQRAKILNEYRRWEEAFDQLLRKARNDPRGPLFERATYMRSQHLAAYLTAQFCACGPETWWYSNTRELKELMDCAKALLALRKEDSFESNFSIDSKRITPLLVIGMPYRHRALRREAVELLSGFPMRECWWDSVLMAKIIQWLSDIDEEGLTDEEYVPLECAWHFAGMKINRPEKTCVLSIFKPSKDPPFEMVTRETTITY